MSEHSQEQAKAHLDRIKELAAQLRQANADEDWEQREDIELTIQEDALEILVRDDWRRPSAEPVLTDTPTEFLILLSTGGPAVRVTGSLDINCLPSNVQLEHQDWFEVWQQYPLSPSDYRAVLEYASQHYFGG